MVAETSHGTRPARLLAEPVWQKVAGTAYSTSTNWRYCRLRPLATFTRRDTHRRAAPGCDALEATLTEIPEHLLARTRARKGGGSSDAAGDGGGSGDSPSQAVTPAAATDPLAPAKGTLPALELPPDPEKTVKPKAPFVVAAEARKKIPVWALPVVLGLPIWAWSYAGTMQEPVQEDPLYTEAAALYTEAGCAGCHGATGGGGSGYQLSDGSVVQTFPHAADQLVHVARGSAAIAGETYGADGRRVAGELGTMPAQQGAMTQTELELVVFHERVVLGGEDPLSPEIAHWEEELRHRLENSDPINLDMLLACADPAVTPGATDEECLISGLGPAEESAEE